MPASTYRYIDAWDGSFILGGFRRKAHVLQTHTIKQKMKLMEDSKIKWKLGRRGHQISRDFWVESSRKKRILEGQFGREWMFSSERIANVVVKVGRGGWGWMQNIVKLRPWSRDSCSLSPKVTLYSVNGTTEQVALHANGNQPQDGPSGPFRVSPENFCPLIISWICPLLCISAAVSPSQDIIITLLGGCRNFLFGFLCSSFSSPLPLYLNLLMDSICF